MGELSKMVDELQSNTPTTTMTVLGTLSVVARQVTSTCALFCLT